MTGLLYLVLLVAPLAAGVIWFRAFLRYHRLLVSRGLFAPPHAPDDFLFRGKNGAYEKSSRQRRILDPQARSGALGPEAAALIRLQDLWLRIAIAALGLPIVAVLIVRPLLEAAPGRYGLSQESASAALLVACVWLGSAVLTMFNLREMRAGHRALLSQYLLGLACVGAGLGAAALWLAR